MLLKNLKYVCFMFLSIYVLQKSYDTVSSAIIPLYLQAHSLFEESDLTLDCENLRTVIDLSKHPCGPLEQSRFPLSFFFKTETASDRAESFERIYEEGRWLLDQNSKSGPGSTMEEADKMINVLHHVVDFLKQELGKDKISLLDSSCGDMMWMPLFLRNRSDVIFTGYDITASNIEAHKETFRNESWTFKVDECYTYVEFLNLL